MPETSKDVKDKFAQKQSLNPLIFIGKALAFIGKPFYLILINSLIGAFFVLYFIGYVARKAFSLPGEFIKKTIKGLRQIKVKTVSVEYKVKKSEKGKALKANNLLKRIKLVFLEIELSLIRIKNFIKGLFKRPKRAKKKAKKKVLAVSKFNFWRPKLFLVLGFLFVIIFSFWFVILKDLPSPQNLTTRQIDVSTKIYDRNGELLYKIYKDKNRTIIPLNEIPNQVRLATLAAEDAEFYSHPGISLKGISRAFFQNLRSGNLQGGSTITQQLVKNALLSPERTLIRKIKEAILSFQVELNFTKDQILEMYLNEVSYGGTAYGIEEASLSYFGKDVRDLNLAESAFLAGLPKSPTKYSPFGQDPNAAFARQKDVLKLMRINRFITSEQEEEALNQRISFIPNKTEIKAPHFVMYVRQLLVDMYGEDVVETGGLEVMTTLDLRIQELAQKAVTEEVDKLKGLNVGNGAALVLDPKTGEILAMVGSRDYFDTENDGNVNVTLRLRQPGSSIKIVNYAYALGNGYTPSSIIDDSPVTFVTPGSEPYSPKNYDGEFNGRITLREAFAESRNIPAVKILASYGVTKMIDLGQSMGITSWEDPSNYGLSLTLGGGGVTLLDLSKVYATVANGGKRPEVNPFVNIKNYQGKELFKTEEESQEQVLDPEVSYMVIDILKDNNARAGAFGTNSYLVVKNHPEVAVKTGTSNDLRDNLTAGFNQDYLVVTWVGNNDNSPMSRIASGITGASPIWNKIITAILNDKSSVDWKIPEKLIKVNICSITGTLPCNGCPTKQEWFVEGQEPKNRCTHESIEKIMEQRANNGKPREGQILEEGISTQRN